MRYRFPITPQGDLYEDFYPRINYLSISLLGKVGYNLGQADLYGILGPHFDVLLEQDGAGFPLFAQNGSADFGSTVGSGLQLSIEAQLHAGLEVRYSPSFQDQHRDNFSVKNKSFEFLPTLGK